MYSNAIDNSDEAHKILRQLYDKAVQFTIPEDSRLVNPERVAAILVIPESCFPFSEYWIGGTENGDNNYHYEGQFTLIFDHTFLRTSIENDDMTDRREFNLVFCPNDPNPKLKELVRIMAFSGQEIITITLVGPYCYDARIVFSRLDRTRGAQMRCVKMIAQPDLMRHYIFMDVRASEVSLFNTMRYYERIPADFIPLITEYCDTCRKHFVHTNCA